MQLTLHYVWLGWKGEGKQGREENGGGVGWRNVIFLRLVQQRKLKGGKIGEKTSHLGPQKFIFPNREENRREKKLQSWNDSHTPLGCPSESISAKSPSPYTVHQNFMLSTLPPTKSHIVDFATHKISHRLPQNLTGHLRHPQNLVSYSSDVLSML